MTNREIFRTAHQMARQGVARFGGSYAVAFAAALRIAYQESKMDNSQKQEFVNRRVAEERARCVGTRARATFNAASVAAKAAAEWEFNNSPEQVARAARIAELTAKGGKLWVGGKDARVYFNAVPVGHVGRTIDFYVEVSTGEIRGAVSDEDRAAASARLA